MIILISCVLGAGGIYYYYFYDYIVHRIWNATYFKGSIWSGSPTLHFLHTYFSASVQAKGEIQHLIFYALYSYITI